jgi:hypothetical protein
MIVGPIIFYKWFFIVANRITSWFGAGYFVKKGYKQKKWRYYFVAVLISLIMLLIMTLVLLLFFHGSTHAEILNPNPRDIDYEAEHLPEAGMNNRFLSLPYATHKLKKNQWTLAVSPGYNHVSVDFIDLKGPLTSFGTQYAFNDKGSFRLVGFYDSLRFSGGQGGELLIPLFHSSIPLDLPENALISNPQGEYVFWGVGPVLDWTFANSRNGRNSWIFSVGALWNRLDLKNYQFDYEITTGADAGQKGVLDHSARYDYVTPFFSFQYNRPLGSKFSMTPRLIAGLPLPKRAWAGRITGPGFDVAGDTKSAGHGTHMGDGFGGLGFMVTHLPSELSFDVGTTLYQTLFEGKIHKGIDKDLVLNITWAHSWN